MKLTVTACILSLLGTTSIASAQLVTQCSQESLSVANAQGRNAWAANCGYVQPSAVSFYNSEGLYVAFTSGCGNPGCNPFIPVVATDPCVPDLVKLGLCEAQAVLTVSNFESGVDVSAPDRFDSCPDGTSCNFSYAFGSALTIEVTDTENLPDCLRFTGWTGACSGQGATCNVTLNGNLSTTARWGRLANCSPGCLVMPCPLRTPAARNAGPAGAPAAPEVSRRRPRRASR
jgi:uncharacterized repeat protein (TIGR02543 family)